MNINLLSTMVLVGLAGCADMSGLGGSKHFACKAPVGVHCESLSATYHNSIANNLPSQRSQGPSGMAVAGPSDSTSARDKVASSMPGFAPVALRTPAREMRIWIKAWQDEERDLVDQSYVYLVIDQGRWRIAHVQHRERDAFARVTAPQSSPEPDIAPQVLPGQPAPALPGASAPAEAPVEPTGR